MTVAKSYIDVGGTVMSEKRLADINWGTLVTGHSFHPSPASWDDETLYFLMLDRFSDGKEYGGFSDAQGHAIAGPSGVRTTPPFEVAVHSGKANRNVWFNAGKTWCGGTLPGLRDKLGYLKRLGITVIWISPVFKQVTNSEDYHGYGIQNFLDVDPHFGTRDELKALVAEAHSLGLRIILDIIFNHAGNIFAYQGNYPYYYSNGQQWPVQGFRANAQDGGSLPFGPVDEQAHSDAWPNGAVWPAEFQTPEAWTRKGEIQGWNSFPQYLEGDFCSLKDLSHGQGDLNPADSWDFLRRIDEYQISPTLRHLTEVFKFWIAFADIDGYRVDTVKHVEPGAMRYFTNVIREFAQSLGKENFYLIGEVTGGRENAVNTVDSTGLSAGLGIDDIQEKLEFLAKGWKTPGNPETPDQEGYFDLFRNGLIERKPTHQWFGRHVVTMFDDHDQVGTDYKFRFCGNHPGNNDALSIALFLNLLTLGIPCIYYGTEQAFNGADHREGTGQTDHSDVFLRECMFGGPFGSYQSTGVHFFDEASPYYRLVGDLCALRRDHIALRRGRQYLRQLSEDGNTFFYPQLVEGSLHYIVAWSRIFNDQEYLCAINTDMSKQVKAWATLDSLLHPAGSEMRCLLCSNKTVMVDPVTVEARNGSATQITVPAGGFAVYR
jgi:glycosidase